MRKLIFVLSGAFVALMASMGIHASTATTFIFLAFHTTEPR